MKKFVFFNYWYIFLYTLFCFNQLPILVGIYIYIRLLNKSLQCYVPPIDITSYVPPIDISFDK
jgi:hypothetical protein